MLNITLVVFLAIVPLACRASKKATSVLFGATISSFDQHATVGTLFDALAHALELSERIGKTRQMFRHKQYIFLHFLAICLNNFSRLFMIFDANVAFKVSVAVVALDKGTIRTSWCRIAAWALSSEAGMSFYVIIAFVAFSAPIVVAHEAGQARDDVEVRIVQQQMENFGTRLRRA